MTFRVRADAMVAPNLRIGVANALIKGALLEVFGRQSRAGYHMGYCHTRMVKGSQPRSLTLRLKPVSPSP